MPVKSPKKKNPPSPALQNRLSELEEKAAQKGIHIHYDLLEAAGLKLKGGICKINGEYHIFVDKRKSFADRIDLYRKDPDSDDFVKIFEHRQLSPYVLEDNFLVTELPRIEFLKTENDETFSTINEAIGNDSGNYFMLFNKDNRLWTVPSDRKDLLLYSRENDWWGWKRENSFSFNGDIVDVVAIRDINVVNGESTLVVFTTKGIYHIL